jgi:hypothetical protein
MARGPLSTQRAAKARANRLVDSNRGAEERGTTGCARDRRGEIHHDAESRLEDLERASGTAHRAVATRNGCRAESMFEAKESYMRATFTLESSVRGDGYDAGASREGRPAPRRALRDVPLPGEAHQKFNAIFS